MEQQHKRRVRYRGTHPRHFHEKYKELNPGKYQDTIAHVIEKGGTPAGMHISIMVPEILEVLQIPTGDAGAGCNAWLRRSYGKNAGMSARTGTHLRVGR